MHGHTQWMSDDGAEVNGATAAGGNNGRQEGGHHDIDDDEEFVAQDDNLDDDNNLDDDEEVPLASVVRDPHLQDLLLEKTKGAKRKSKLEQLEIDSNTPLYDSGRGLGESRLRVALDVLQMKAKHGWTDTSVDDILEYVKDLLPAGNTCPGSLAEAKRITCPLDLPHEKYHACINDCIMYRKEHMDKTKCPVCEAERYKKGKKKAPRKVVWYFPLAPRLQRFYADRKEAKLMRWHAERKEAVLNDEERIEHPVLTHPSDASQWKALDNEFGSFGADPRNIRLGASTDGFNPFGNQSSTHSTWPVFVWIYNLPPWLCMKRKYIQMSMLIQGPTQPGNDINMYLELLKEELETLWAEEGVDTWDAVAEEYFPLRAALITTVQDYLGYGYISCQVCHGHKACVRCMEETMFLQLGKDPGSSKTVYMGHRRWLQKTDPWRKRGDLFDGTNEPRGPPRKKSGEEIDTLLKGWKECPAPGKIRQKPGEKKKKKETTPLIGVWKRRSVFWDLPYWKILDTPHCLDVMQVKAVQAFSRSQRVANKAPPPPMQVVSFDGSNSMAPPSAGNDNVIMETPPAAGNVAGARDSPSMPGSSPSVTCTPAAACAGPSTLAELNALTALSTPCTFLMRVNDELKDVARGSILRPLDKKWHTRDMEDDVYRVEVDRALPGYEDLFPPNQPHGADDDSPLNLASLKGWVLLWPKTLIRINTYSGSTTSKDKHLAAPQVSVPPRQPAAPVVIAPPQRPAAPEVSAPPQRPAAPVVSAPPQQPAAPEAEEYERDDFQWDIPTSSQVVHEDAPASKYVCSKKLFDSQETAEEENPEEVATAAVKKMLSPNTLRATATTVMDGPALQTKKRKRPAKKDAKDKAAAKSKDKVPLLDKLPNNWRPLHHLGEPMLPEHVLNLLTGDMASLHNQVQYLEKQLLKSKDPSYPLFVAKVPTGMNFVEKYPADLCFIRFNDIFSIFRMQMLHFSVVRLVALSLSSQIVKEGTPTIAIMDPFYMRESIICNAGDRAIATRQVEDFMLANIKKGAILIPYFPEDKFCTLIVVHPQHSHAVYLDSGRDKKKDYTHIKALLNDALTGFANKAGPLKVERKSRGGLVLTHTTNFPCLRQSKEDNGMDAWYAILQMQEYIKYADDMLLPESLRNRSGEFFYGYGLPPNDEIELRLEMSRDERPFNTLEGCRPFPLGMPTTYVVYKGRVPGVYDDWEDCRRQVHRFSGNSYKGYPTRVEAEGRYARYLAGEMRDMRRNRMKTMAFVMMVIVTMLVMFYVIVV
ncbi:hypothetical protein QYE76_069888 [Lolium multiflorum]|uniref:Uncharacterized protein n=1 Tax=Lolium multiflorum TaxID=4521 RepID=A0AAD8WDF1_LOLMU|nr:hypothetical protein QYE76_069888 [Lolium multiflorum]